MKSDRVIWDWNGTLLDDAWLCVEVLNGMLARRRMPAVDMAAYRNRFRFPVRAYYEEIGFDFVREPFEIVAAEFISEYDRRRHECRLRRGARSALKTLADAGLAQCVLSVYPQPRLEDATERFGLRPFFDGVFGLPDHHARGKIEAGRRLAAALGPGRGRAVMIGDTLHDHEVAREMGVRLVLVNGGHQSPDRLRACGAPVADSLEAAASLVLAGRAQNCGR